MNSRTVHFLLPLALLTLVHSHSPLLVRRDKALKEPTAAANGVPLPPAASGTPLTNSSSAAPTITPSAVVKQESLNNPSSMTIKPTFKPGQAVESASVNPTPAPAGGCPAVGEGVMTWRISNNYGIPLSVSYLNNADSPSAIGCPGAAQLTASATTEVVFPTGWAGRIFVGKNAQSGDSLIEGSTTGWNDIDVSYVDGYSVPITCGTEKEVLTGCNIDLWKTGTVCGNTEGDNAVCRNPTVDTPNGPATDFFLPCQ